MKTFPLNVCQRPLGFFLWLGKIALILLGAFSPGAALGDVRDWLVTSGTWSVDANWYGGTAPTISSTAVIGNNRTALATSGVSGTYGELYLGGSLGTGTLSITGGNLTGTYVNLGLDGGIAVVSGGTWTTTETMNVGNKGDGSLTINGGYVRTNRLRLGEGVLVPSMGTVTVNSGTLISADAIDIARVGSTFTINGGLVATRHGTIASASGDNATAFVTGGTWTNEATLNVSRSGTAALYISGGLVTSASTTMASGATGDGTLVISGSSGNRGVLQTGYITSGVDRGTLLFDGGILRANADRGEFLQDFGAYDVMISAGGAFIDSGSHSIGISRSMGGIGGLTKMGVGTLWLIGSSTYGGGTTVKVGTLSISGMIDHASGAMYVGEASGDLGLLSVDGGRIINSQGYVGSLAGATGTATVNSGTWTNTINLAIGRSGTGSLLLNAGYVSAVDSYVGLNSTGRGDANVTSGTWANSGGLTIGSSGSGSLTINGGRVSAVNGIVGSQNGGRGTAQVSGGIWNNTGNLTVGSSGMGTLLINGGFVSNSTGYIGYASGGTGSVTVSSGSWTNAAALFVGTSGTGVLNLTDSGLVTVNSGSGTVTLASDIGSRGTLNIGAGGAIGTLNAAVVTGGSGVATVNFNHTGSISFAPRLAGSLNVVKDAAGVTTLSGSNSYSGTTTVNAGTLRLTDNSSSQAFAIASGATLNLDVASGSRSFLSATGITTFSGSGSIVKTGDGTARWDNVDAVFALSTGSLIDVQGGVFVGGSFGDDVWTNNKSDLNVAAGARFNGAEANVRVDALTGSGTVQSGFSGSYQGFTFGVDNASSTFSGVLADNPGFAGNYVKAGTGTQILSGNNTYTGRTDINDGTLVLGHAGALATTGTISFGGGTLQFTSSNTTDYSARLSNAASQRFRIDTGNNNVTFATGLASTGGSLLKIGSGTLALSGASTYTGTTTVDVGRLKLMNNNNSSAFAIASGAALEINVASGSRDGVANTGFSGGGTLVKSGMGTAYWSASASFALASGSLIDVQAGVLLGGSHGNEVWTTNKSDLNVASGAQFNGVEANVRVDALTGAGTILSGYSGGYQNFTFGVDDGSGTFNGVLANNPGFTANYVKTGTGTQILTGSNSYTGTTTISIGTLQIGDGGATGTLGSGAVVNNGSLFINRSGPLTLANAISGSGAMTTTGGGVVTLTGSNTYLGTTTVKSGTLAIGSGASITHYDSNLTIGDMGGENAALSLTGGDISSLFSILGNSAGSVGSATMTAGTWGTAAAMHVGNEGTGNLQITGGSVIGLGAVVGNYETGMGTATVTSGTWTIISGLFLGFSGTGSLLVNGGYVTDNFSQLGLNQSAIGTAVVTSGTWAQSGMIVGRSGTGTVTISGGLASVAGNVITGNDATGSGTIALTGSSGNRGVLQAHRLTRGDGAGVLSFNGGVLRAGINESNFLSGYDANDVTIGGGGAFIDSYGFAVGISTILSGSGALTKQGAGQLTLSGSNSYSGGTFVQSGTLAAANNRAMGTSTVTVEGGVFLIEEGISVANSVTLAGGSLAQQVGAGTDLTTLKTFTDGVSGGISTLSELLDGTTSAGATITSGFAATSAALNDEILQSDVFHFSGVPVIGPDGATDLFVLQLSVSSLKAGSFLGWLDTDTNLWINAVEGNIGASTPTPFLRGYNAATDFHLGFYGIDMGNGSVWAVLNHNSDFGVIPEPGTLALIGLGIGALFLRRRRRN